MAGTLTVQNLQGPSTGANANKILIPSGQTLDVSGGTLTPSAGQVVQCVSSDSAQGWTTTTSTSYVDSGLSLSITPKFASSVILVDYHFPMVHTSNASTYAGVFRIYRNTTDLSLTSYDQGFHYNNGGSVPLYPSIKLECRDASHNSTSLLTYKVYMRTTLSGAQVHLTHNGSAIHLKLWEIAQ